jgi:hypothetical protein
MVPLMRALSTLTTFFCVGVGDGGVGGVVGAGGRHGGRRGRVAAALPMPATEPRTVTVIALPTSAGVGAYVGAFVPTGVDPANPGSGTSWRRGSRCPARLSAAARRRGSP